MRTFVGLEPGSDSKLAIENWRERAYPGLSGVVPMDNFHVTLCFLGEITASQLEAICSSDSLARTLQLHITEVGYFSKPGIGFLALEPTPVLMHLQARLQQQFRQWMKLKQPHKFVPHISFCRQQTSPLPAPLIEPEFRFSTDHYHLYESVQHQSRVHYRIIHSWNNE